MSTPLRKTTATVAVAAALGANPTRNQTVTNTLSPALGYTYDQIAKYMNVGKKPTTPMPKPRPGTVTFWDTGESFIRVSLGFKVQDKPFVGPQVYSYFPMHGQPFMEEMAEPQWRQILLDAIDGSMGKPFRGFKIPAGIRVPDARTIVMTAALHLWLAPDRGKQYLYPNFNVRTDTRDMDGNRVILGHTGPFGLLIDAVGDSRPIPNLGIAGEVILS